MFKKDINFELTRAREEAGGYNFETVSISAIESLDEEAIKIGGNFHEITDWAGGQLLRKLKIPRSLYAELDVNLKSKLLRHQVGLLVEEEIKIRYRQESVVTAILPTDFTELKTEFFLSKLPDWECVEANWDLERPLQNFRFVSRDVVLPEGHFMGFDLSISEVGGWSLILQALIYVQVCENGLLRARENGGPYFKAPMTMLEGPEFEAVGSILNDRLMDDAELANLNTQMTISQEDKINLRDEVEMWTTTRIPKIVPRKVMARIEGDTMDADISSYDLAQLVSNVGRHINFKRRLHFEGLAGKLMNLQIVVAAN